MRRPLPSRFVAPGNDASLIHKRLTKFEQQSSGNKKEEDDANVQTEDKLKEIRGISDEHGKKVVDDLLKAVTDVKPQVPDRS